MPSGRIAAKERQIKMTIIKKNNEMSEWRGSNARQKEGRLKLGG